jgi:2-polyprenyl-3-methyl-5-hydroxy-6-metoxy-1,4-benzoquinol methylase
MAVTASEPQILIRPDKIAGTIRSVRWNHSQSVKEIVRHGLLRTGTIGILDRLRSRKGYMSADYIRSDAAATFRQIYADGGWVHREDQESRSGVGSEASATEGLLERIEAAMTLLGCRSLVDVGCGDWNWMKRKPFDFDYTGVDIVSELIAENQRYARENVRFLVCNAIKESPQSADFALCREVLFHLSFADIKSVVRNVRRTTKYFCATTDFDIWFNSDIRTGDFRKINLLRAPFNFPTPVCLMPDTERYLGVWESGALP